MLSMHDFWPEEACLVDYFKMAFKFQLRYGLSGIFPEMGVFIHMHYKAP